MLFDFCWLWQETGVCHNSTLITLVFFFNTILINLKSQQHLWIYCPLKFHSYSVATAVIFTAFFLALSLGHLPFLKHLRETGGSIFEDQLFQRSVLSFKGAVPSSTLFSPPYPQSDIQTFSKGFSHFLCYFPQNYRV